MSADPFSVPPGGGSGLDELVGRLVIFTDITIRENQPNPFNAGQHRDEADAALVVLDGDGSREKSGIFGTRLVRQCKARAQFGFAYGRLASVNVNGKNTLELVDPGPADTERVKAWITAYAPHYLGGSVPAPPAPAAPATPPAPPATSATPASAPAPGTTWHPGVAAPPPAGGSAPPADPPF
ncbi:hypothetical protein AGRA3207_000211 [Actinomadura graeca]|uniref:Uncharacterized protein n=1 Tax=Actinomadura graeca TaxID=2750812 RepID=A0ABX8QM08_9ACTN|nr:hypothetical protein [Actinomadura graeca]QXJ19648.1 hypothetical protein AGRA3207_000211 [Actinomadura graeca]